MCSLIRFNNIITLLIEVIKSSRTSKYYMWSRAIFRFLFIYLEWSFLNNIRCCQVENWKLNYIVIIHKWKDIDKIFFLDKLAMPLMGILSSNWSILSFLLNTPKGKKKMLICILIYNNEDDNKKACIHSVFAWYRRMEMWQIIFGP